MSLCHWRGELVPVNIFSSKWHLCNSRDPSPPIGFSDLRACSKIRWRSRLSFIGYFKLSSFFLQNLFVSTLYATKSLITPIHVDLLLKTQLPHAKQACPQEAELRQTLPLTPGATGRRPRRLQRGLGDNVVRSAAPVVVVLWLLYCDTKAFGCD